MKQLIPAPVISKPTFDALSQFPDDVARLVKIASNAGYQITPQNAGEIWRRVSESVCAGWLSPISWGESACLADMLRNALVVEDSKTRLAPPDGYETWLDYAVDSMGTRPLEIAPLFEDRPSVGAPTWEELRQAARTELEELRRRAGALEHGR